jgi:hypothetical protein
LEAISQGITMQRPTVEAAPGVFIARKHVIPPAVMAQRMQRYSIVLMIVAFLLVGLNLPTLTLEKVLWFAAGVTAAFAILCGVALVILNASAWNFDRLKQELHGGPEATDMK